MERNTHKHTNAQTHRLPQLLALGYEPSTVASLYERLVRMCLGVLRGGSADLVLERAEDAGLSVRLAKTGFELQWGRGTQGV